MTLLITQHILNDIFLNKCEQGLKAQIGQSGNTFVFPSHPKC